MNTPKAIFFGLALIAVAVFARDIVTPADAGTSETGGYAISNTGGSSGNVELCPLGQAFHD